MRGHITRGRAAGTWYLRVELQHGGNGKRRQRRETVRGTKADAQRRLHELLVEVEAGGYADAQRLTVAKIAERWLATKEHRVAAKTYAFYSSHVRLYIVPTLGSLRAEALRPAYIEAAIGKWARGKRHDRERGVLSARSVGHLFNTLRTMLRWGVKMGMLVRNAADAVEPPRFERKEMRALDPAGVARLLEAAQGTDLRAVIAVAIGTGLRRGELLALRWSDVNLDARRLTVHRSLETVKGVTRTKPPKTARSARTIALPPFVAGILREERSRQEDCANHAGQGGTGLAGFLRVRTALRGSPARSRLCLPASSKARSSRTSDSTICATRSGHSRLRRESICRPFRAPLGTNQRRSLHASICTRLRVSTRTQRLVSTRCSEMR